MKHNESLLLRVNRMRSDLLDEIRKDYSFYYDEHKTDNLKEELRALAMIEARIIVEMDIDRLMNDLKIEAIQSMLPRKFRKDEIKEDVNIVLSDELNDYCINNMSSHLEDNYRNRESGLPSYF